MSYDGTTYEDAQWWEAHKHGQEPHVLMVDYVKDLRMKQATRYDNFRRQQNVYEWGYKSTSAAEVGSMNSTMMQDVALQDDLLSFNELQGVVQTLVSNVTATRILPLPITTGGGYEAQLRAKRLQDAIKGELDQNQMEEICEDTVFEAAIQGAGFCKIFDDGGRISLDFIPADDITVDDAEGRYRKPPSIYHRKYMDRFVLLNMFGKDDLGLYGSTEERRNAILTAPHVDPKGENAGSHDQIEVWEGYHLPSGRIEEDEDGNHAPHDGRHSICLINATLLDEEFSWPTFPIKKYCPYPRRKSFWGLSLVHKLAPVQREYEKNTSKIQDANELMGSTNIIYPEGADLEEEELANGQGLRVMYKGNVAPREFNPTPVNPQTFEWNDRLASKLNVLSGVSEMSTRSEIPAGMTNASGKALQTYSNIESKRLLPYFRALERFMVEVSQAIILVARDITKKDPKYNVKYRNEKMLESINWGDVLEDEDSFVLSIPATNMLATDPAAKIEQVTEMMNAGLYTKEEAARLLAMPDLQSENEMDQADVNVVDMLCDRVFRTGKQIQPQPFVDMQMAINRTRKFINKCLANGEPDNKIENVRSLLLKFIDLQKAANPPPPPAEPAAPMGLGAPPPMPPPPMPMGPPPMPPPMAA